MQYTTLGRTGIRVSRLCLGTLGFYRQADEPAAHHILDRALELGINFIDTADIYYQGHVEEYIGAWLPEHRHDVVLATKVRGRMGPGSNDAGLSRVHIMKAVEDSLRRLRTDYIDLYQTHAPDDSTPIETMLQALDDLVHQGKVRAIACSNYGAGELCKALWTSDLRNLARFESVQPCYSLLYRQPEAELLPLCLSEQIGVIPYEPLAAGVLTGKHQWGQPPVPGTRYDVRADQYPERYWFEPNFRIIDQLRPISTRSGRTLAQYAQAWLLAHPAVTSVITGATSVEQVEENAAAVDNPLSEEDYRAGGEIAQGAVTYSPTGPRQA